MSRYRKGTALQAQDSTVESITGTAAVDEFLAHHQRQGSSPRYLTELQSYLVGSGRRTSWTPLLPWTTRQAVLSLAAVSKAHLQQYLDETQHATTHNVYFKVCSIVSRFLRWAVDEGYLTALPLQIVRPKRLRSEIKVFTPQEVQRLASVVKRESARDWAIFLLLVDTGMRASELCSLRYEDVRLDRGEVVVRAVSAKNRRSRTIPLAASIASLRKYRGLRTAATERCEQFFLAYYSTPVFAGGPHRQDRVPMLGV